MLVRNGGDWRDAFYEIDNKAPAAADKKKKLVGPIPTNISGVTAVLKTDARTDIKDIESVVDLQVGDQCRSDVPGTIVRGKVLMYRV